MIELERIKELWEEVFTYIKTTEQDAYEAVILHGAADADEHIISKAVELDHLLGHKPDEQIVHLTYFKPSGKYYSEGTYKSEATHLAQACEEVRSMMQQQTLPDLIKGHSPFNVLVVYKDVPNFILNTTSTNQVYDYDGKPSRGEDEHGNRSNI